MSEGRGGAGRRDRGSRCGDRTLANRLLHDASRLHLVHHIFFRERGGEERMADEGEIKSRGAAQARAEE